jgi:hypothetical protein
MLWVIFIQSKMTLPLSSDQQQKLLDLYQSFQVPINEVTIQMNSGAIRVKCNNNETVIIVPEISKKSKKKDINLYIEEAYNADIEIDMTVQNEEDYPTLLQYAIDKEKSNGQRILAYSKVWEQAMLKIKNEKKTLTQLQIEIWTLINRHGKRFLGIAQRSHKLIEVVGDYLPRDFKLITPTWLLHTKSQEFESFIEMSKAKYREGIEPLAGARK